MSNDFTAGATVAPESFPAHTTSAPRNNHDLTERAGKYPGLIPIRQPRSNEFVTIGSSCRGLWEQSGFKDSVTGEFFILSHDANMALPDDVAVSRIEMALAVSDDGSLFFWFFTLELDSFSRSTKIAMDAARRGWVRLVPSQRTLRFELDFPPEGFLEPRWKSPDLSTDDALVATLGSHWIGSMDHPYIRSLSTRSTELTEIASSSNTSEHSVEPDPAIVRADAENELLNLAHDHFAEIYIAEVAEDPEYSLRYSEEPLVPYWCGRIQYYDQEEYIDVFGTYGEDDSEATKLAVIARLKAVIRKRRYLLHGAFDAETGDCIRGMRYRPVQG